MYKCLPPNQKVLINSQYKQVLLRTEKYETEGSHNHAKIFTFHRTKDYSEDMIAEK